MAASRWVLDGVYLRRTNIRRMEETFASPNRRFTVAPARRCLVGLAVVAWIGWEKRFASAGLRAAREGTPKKKRDWASTIVDVIQFGLPTVLAVGLAIDGSARASSSTGTPVHGGGLSDREARVHEAPPGKVPPSTRTVPLHSASDPFFVPRHIPGLPSPCREHRHASPPVRPH